MKVSQIVESVQRLSMIKNKSKYKASMNHKNEELKTEWLNISHEASELLEKYNNANIIDTQIIKEYARKDWLLYLKMKVLIKNMNDLGE